MSFNTISKRSATSADASTAVTINIPDIYIHHQIKITTTGSPSAGTAAVTDENGQAISGTISLTAPVSYLFDGSVDSVTVTPTSFDGTNFTVEVRSWKQLQG